MISIISLIISSFALGISGLTAWLTLLRKGTVKMTQPKVIYFGPDGGLRRKEPRWKIYLRALLYSTSKRGSIVESMYVRLRRGEMSQNFTIWTYGDRKDLVRGSGLFVPETGISASHHFLIPPDATSFRFLPGYYSVEIFAAIIGESTPKLLYSVQLEVDAKQTEALENDDQGLYFDWGPDSAKYHPYLHSMPKDDLPDFLREFIG